MRVSVCGIVFPPLCGRGPRLVYESRFTFFDFASRCRFDWGLVGQASIRGLCRTMVTSSLVRDLLQSLGRTCTCRRKPGVESLTVIRLLRPEHPVDDVDELSRCGDCRLVLAPPLLDPQVELGKIRSCMEVLVGVNCLGENPPQGDLGPFRIVDRGQTTKKNGSGFEEAQRGFFTRKSPITA